MEHNPSWEANWFSVKKFPAFYGTRRYTRARHLSPSWVRSTQSVPPHSTPWRSILILYCHLRIGFSSGLFPSGFHIKTLYKSLHHTCYMHRPSHSSRFDHPSNIGWGVQIIAFLFVLLSSENETTVQIAGLDFRGLYHEKPDLRSTLNGIFKIITAI
jgi:hypothetical protein